MIKVQNSNSNSLPVNIFSSMQTTIPYEMHYCP